MVDRKRVEDNLRQMLRDLFAADSRGAQKSRLARAHGYTDGYMMALVDLGLATQDELFQVVVEERQRASLPPSDLFQTTRDRGPEGPRA